MRFGVANDVNSGSPWSSSPDRIREGIAGV
jgi:hypothetical protein